MDDVGNCVDYSFPKVLYMFTFPEARKYDSFGCPTFYATGRHIRVEFIEFFRSYICSHKPVILGQFKSTNVGS